MLSFLVVAAIAWCKVLSAVVCPDIGDFDAGPIIEGGIGGRMFQGIDCGVCVPVAKCHRGRILRRGGGVV